MGQTNWTSEQREIIDARNENILVSAAAGSGKTTVLVERIFQRMTDPVNPVGIDRFVVVTFTNLAAAQMKDRLRRRIDEELAAHPDNEYLARQSVLVSQAHICTVHSFCGFVIKNYFHRIGLDPAYRQGNEAELKMLKKDVLEDLLEEEYEKEQPDFMELASMDLFNKNDQGLEDMILAVYDSAMSEPFPKDWLKKAEDLLQVETEEQWNDHPVVQWVLTNCRYMAEALDQEVDSLLDLCDEPGGPYMYRPCMEGLKDILSSLMQARTCGEWQDVVEGISFGRLSSKKDEDVSGEAREWVKKRYDACKKKIQSYAQMFFFQPEPEHRADLKQTGGKISGLLRLTREFMERYGETKRDRGIMDYDDLEQFALKILLRWDEEKQVYVRTEAAGELAEYFEEVMIDEYQDSNRVQETLLTSISRQGLASYASNLFMVGDVKQSIYRFRNACPELFVEKMDAYHGEQAAGHRIDLHYNFRSRDTVLQSCNQVFEDVMHRDIGGVEYDLDARLVPGASFKPPEKGRFAGKTKVMLGLTGTKEGVALKREDEGYLALRYIQDIMNPQDPMQVIDKENSYRPAEYRDIVILMRSIRKDGQKVYDILTEHGIPVVMEHDQGFFDTREIQILYQMMQVIDNPLVDMPLAGVLMSPAFDFTEEEMAKIRLRHKDCGFYDAMGQYDEADGVYEHIQQFLDVLSRLRSKVTYASTAEILQDIYDETGIYDKIRTMPQGIQRVANMDYLMEQARAYDEVTYRGLHQFVRYIEQFRRQQEDLGEVNLFGQEENAVRIMTIHKSKGLEFPVCILMGLGKTLKVPDRKAVRTDSEFGISIQAEDPEISTIKNTFMFQAMGHKNQMESLGEELRILYVAMTRAKEQLCMTGMVSSLEEMGLDYNSRSEMNHYCDMVLPAVYRRGDLFDLEVLEWQDLVLEEASQQKEVDREKDRLYNFDTSKVYNVSMHEILELRKTVREEKEVLPVKVSVSELKEKSMEELDMEEFHILSAQEEPDEEPVPSFMGGGKEKRENAGAAYGTVWHQVMAFLDFSHVASRREIRESLEQVVQAGHVRREDLAVIQVSRLEQFFQSELGKQMCLAYEDGRLHREQPFVTSRPAKEVLADSGSEEAVLIQGIIDGYYFTEDGIVLMDYKTDRIQPGKEQDLADRYRTQMAVYRQALQDNTGRPVIKTVLYSFSLGKEVELEF